jgi:hypothetical protein
MKFRDRDAVQIENSAIRVTVLKEGGHIAEILHKQTGVNPLWIPPWKSIEPSSYDPALHPEYGLNEESKLLAGIMGHNLCLDFFGPPSSDEAKAGLTVHGEASVVRYEAQSAGSDVEVSATLPVAGVAVKRSIHLGENGASIQITETVENLSSMDRPLGWTQHVTMGPPFLQHGVTRFNISSRRSRVFEAPGFGGSNLEAGTDFTWPLAPVRGGGQKDLRVYTDEKQSAKFTTHLMNADGNAFFAAYNPINKLLFGYQWKSDDFPWLGIWEENRSRTAPPWNSQAVTLGMEFGVSPFPEPKRKMVERGRLFDTPTYRWLGARNSVTVEYSVVIRTADQMPAKL